MEYDAHMDTQALARGIDPRGRRSVAAVNNDQRILNNTADFFAGNITLNRFLHLASTRVFNVFNDFMGLP